MTRFRTKKELKIEKIIMVRCENCNHKFPAEERKENIYCPYCGEKKFSFYTKWRIISDKDVKKRLMSLTPKERKTAIEALVMKEQLRGFGMM